jgi:hypothetical protein
VTEREAPDTLPAFDAQASCHRCLIYLGDLARYKELHSDGKAKDWAIVANYYLQAAALWPASGNPHNQVSILCGRPEDVSKFCEEASRHTAPVINAETLYSLAGRKIRAAVCCHGFVRDLGIS